MPGKCITQLLLFKMQSREASELPKRLACGRSSLVCRGISLLLPSISVFDMATSSCAVQRRQDAVFMKTGFLKLAVGERRRGCLLCFKPNGFFGRRPL